MNSILWRKVGWAALIVFLAGCPISGSRALAKREGFTNEEQMRSPVFCGDYFRVADDSGPSSFEKKSTSPQT
jgi:hypothetical protein